MLKRKTKSLKEVLLGSFAVLVPPLPPPGSLSSAEATEAARGGSSESSPGSSTSENKQGTRVTHQSLCTVCPLEGTIAMSPAAALAVV